jgi:hypothetical protein
MMKDVNSTVIYSKNLCKYQNVPPEKNNMIIRINLSNKKSCDTWNKILRKPGIILKVNLVNNDKPN